MTRGRVSLDAPVQHLAEDGRVLAALAAPQTAGVLIIPERRPRLIIVPLRRHLILCACAFGSPKSSTDRVREHDPCTREMLVTEAGADQSVGTASFGSCGQVWWCKIVSGSRPTFGPSILPLSAALVAECCSHVERVSSLDGTTKGQVERRRCVPACRRA
jgi:hypothetical protein